MILIDKRIKTARFVGFVFSVNEKLLITTQKRYKNIKIIYLDFYIIDIDWENIA